MLEKNSKIINFTFQKNICSKLSDKYSFEIMGNKYLLMYSGMKPYYNRPVIEIGDYEFFNRKIVSIIKNWKRKYPPTLGYENEEIWTLDIRFLNRKKAIHYEGHIGLTRNCYDLEKFLENYFAKTRSL